MWRRNGSSSRHGSGACGPGGWYVNLSRQCRRASCESPVLQAYKPTPTMNANHGWLCDRDTSNNEGSLPKHCPRRQLQMGEDSHQAKHDGEPINFINLLPKYPSLTRNTARNAARALSRAARALPGYVFACPRGYAPLTRQCSCLDHLVDVYQLWASFAFGWSPALGTSRVLCSRSPLVWDALARDLCN